jgi:hypothetical protein
MKFPRLTGLIFSKFSQHSQGDANLEIGILSDMLKNLRRFHLRGGTFHLGQQQYLPLF